MKKDIILVGGGGHCKNCIDVIESSEEYNIVGILDLKQNIGNKILNHYVTDTDANLEKIVKQCTFFLITLGYVSSNPNLRQNLFNTIKKMGGNFPVIISPFSRVSNFSKIKDGTIIMHNATVNAESSIGFNSIINTGAIVDHDVIIGNNAIIMSGVVLNGKSVIGDNCYISSNSIVSTGAMIEAGNVYNSSK